MLASRKICVAILGPTASGKTKLGVAIAKAFPGEVISVDSLQCYKPGSIITAKPQPEETEGVPHHLIDYLEAEEEPHDFVSRAFATVDNITTRNRLPILVGGSTSLTLPLLRDLFNAKYEVMAINLVPHHSVYQQLIETRAEDMLRRGLLSELVELQHLEKILINGKADFTRGIWKAIGYQEFYPYLQAVGKLNGVSTNNCGHLYKKGRASLFANTLQYGKGQLEWMQHTLTPFLHQHKAATASLSVIDKASWISDVQKPVLTMISEFYHNSQLLKGLSPRKSPKKRVVCLFGGSSSGNDPTHIEAAKSLAVALHHHNISLVYGGGTTGIMGQVASSLVALSGPSAVQGIIPAALASYEEKFGDDGPIIDGEYLSRFGRRTIVRDMHTRKRLMIQSVLQGLPGSGFVALSGGYGTIEELLEITTWYQLGIHDCVVTVFSVNGFYDGLLDWIDQVLRRGFISSKHANIIRVAKTADKVIACLADGRLHSRRHVLEWL